MNPRKTFIWGAAAVLALFMISCSSDSTTTKPEGDGDFADVVNSGGEFEAVQASADTVADPTVTETVGNETFFCTTTHYDITNAPADFMLFNPSAGVIWPGNLVQGATLASNPPENIYAKRGPGNVTMTILNGATNVSRQIDEVSLGAVQQAMNDIIADVPQIMPARFQLDYGEVQSQQQLAVSLGVSVHYYIANISSRLAVSTEENKTSILVKLNQAFFDMVYEPPSKLEDFFAPDVTPSDLDPYMGPGNPPAFIRQVTYGRIYYLLMESTSSRKEMSASISASFDAAAAGMTIDADAYYGNKLQNLQIHCLAMGGDQQLALAAFRGDFTALTNFLRDGATIETGMPLSYVACALAPPHKVVNMAVAANYDMIHCVPVGESFENPIFWYQASGEAGDLPGLEPIVLSDNHVTSWKNRLFYDDRDKDAIPVDGYDMAGTYAATAINNKPAVSFAAPTSTVGGSLGYSGLAFQDSSFTVVAVVRMESTVASYPAYFMFGNSTSDQRNLKVGFRDDARVTMTTGSGQVLNADVGNPVTNFNVLTFVFSRKDGMSIFVNLDTTPAATDPSLTEPLLGYTGARIGSSNGARIQIAEIKSYGIAFHNAQKDYVVKKLMQKYGI